MLWRWYFLFYTLWSNFFYKSSAFSKFEPKKLSQIWNISSKMAHNAQNMFVLTCMILSKWHKDVGLNFYLIKLNLRVLLPLWFCYLLLILQFEWNISFHRGSQKILQYCSPIFLFLMSEVQSLLCSKVSMKALQDLLKKLPNFSLTWIISS